MGLPDPGLRREHEACRSHCLAKRGDRAQAIRIDYDVGVGRERLIGGEPPLRPEVHGLSPDDHQRVEVIAQRVENVEQYLPCLDVFDPKRFGHQAATGLVTTSSDGARQRVGFVSIQPRSAAPSDGMRPMPVRQSRAS